MSTIREPARDVPVAHEADVCVVGGSCTGVFAAVQAARLGASVAIIECNGFFGGVATAGLVNVWHSLNDITGERRIIGGLTAEVIERLKARDAVSSNQSPHSAYILNTEELKIELDALVREARARAFLHARFVAPVMDGARLEAVVIEDKTGRRAVRARCFVDATGDGDLVHRMGLPTRTLSDLQPPTTCAVIEGLARVAEANPGFSPGKIVFDASYAEALPPGFLWSSHVTGSADLTMVAGTRVKGADCSDADQLTLAEMEGRRQVRQMLDLLRRHVPRGSEVFLRALPAYIGIRETRHACCLHMLTEGEVLRGERFEDAIASGSYRVDVHHSDKPGLTFRYLDGREEYVAPGQPTVHSRWLEEGKPHATFYQIPYRCLVPRGATNVLAAGRLIDADRGAYGAIRVMVNCNQTGEAAGAACALALKDGIAVNEVKAEALRATLKKLGAIIV
jgi:hypothetical protein